MEPRITIITLGTQDLARAKSFYSRLGFPLHEWTAGDFVAFNLQGIMLALYPFKLLADDAGVPQGRGTFDGVTLSHNVTSKEGVDTILQEATRAGGAITAPASDKEWGVYSGYFSDLDGHLWEVAYRKESENP